MSTESKTPMLLLWGCTGVGKTSLLTAGLFADRARMSGVDWAAAADVDAKLTPGWRNLNGNTVMKWTSDTQITVDLPFKPARSEDDRDDRRLLIRDIRGGVAHEYEKPEHREFLRRADAVLFVMEWQGPQKHEEFRVIHDICEIVRDRVLGLAFTKCERALPSAPDVWKYDPERPTNPEWWLRDTDLEQREQGLLRSLEAVWPTSVYGFYENRPACLLDEFGGTIPFRIKPVNTTDVFLWYFRRLELC